MPATSLRGLNIAASELALRPAIVRPKPRAGRYFFMGMAALAIAILAAAFVPEFVQFARGTFPIAPILHVHAALMGAWVAAFICQVYLGATGRIALHRKFGLYAFLIGWLAWASMVFVEFRGIIVYPVPTVPRDYDWNLPGPYIYLTFPVYLTWAYYERRRPAWHKRLMTFALFLTLLAAAQRYPWISHKHGYSPLAATIDAALLIPLAVYDLRALKGRLHPATLRGSALLLGSQGILLMLWGTTLWRNFAALVTHALHG